MQLAPSDVLKVTKLDLFIHCKGAKLDIVTLFRLAAYLKLTYVIRGEASARLDLGPVKPILA